MGWEASSCQTSASGPQTLRQVMMMMMYERVEVKMGLGADREFEEGQVKDASNEYMKDLKAYDRIDMFSVSVCRKSGETEENFGTVVMRARGRMDRTVSGVDHRQQY